VAVMCAQGHCVASGYPGIWICLTSFNSGPPHKEIVRESLQMGDFPTANRIRNVMCPNQPKVLVISWKEGSIDTAVGKYVRETRGTDFSAVVSYLESVRRPSNRHSLLTQSVVARSAKLQIKHSL